MNKKIYPFSFYSAFLSITNFCTKPGRSQSLVREGRIRRGQARLQKVRQDTTWQWKLQPMVRCHVAWKPATPQKLETPGKTPSKDVSPAGNSILARAYNDLYRFEDAIETYETYISDLRKRKRSTEEAEQLLEKSKSNLRMLKGVEEVCFIDSFVVDKENFLDAYKISPRIGQAVHVRRLFQRFR